MGRSGGVFESPSCGSSSHHAGLTKAEVPVLVTDDEVIEQWQVEHVGGGAQSQREPRIVRARCRRHARWGIVRGGDHPAELKCLLCYSQTGCLTLAWVVDQGDEA